ncbi:hypothetical protein Pmani_018338 [Petrolisthes manimaculis]|uniref:Uncharacterized protein n=1 Tax=Petrolisthes manimaculis TaxID=1843537 RepID=A0AAE1PN59_9EUCA|nr:hypothetical protein Pmani_018338 [Petrolisthes manimaculis]
MADIHVQSELIQGPVRVAVLETDLPIPGVTFLLGNDLAGHGMIPDVVVSEKPVNESPTAKLDQEKPHLFPVCVVTRSQTVSEAVDSPSLSHRDTLFSQVMNRENLIRAQEEDPALAKLRHIADDKSINAIPEPGLTQNGELGGETEVVDFPSPSGNPKNSELLGKLDQYLADLSPSQRESLKILFGKYSSVISDVPGFCNTHVHDVILRSPEIFPIK